MCDKGPPFPSPAKAKPQSTQHPREPPCLPRGLEKLADVARASAWSVASFGTGLLGVVAEVVLLRLRRLQSRVATSAWCAGCRPPRRRSAQQRWRPVLSASLLRLSTPTMLARCKHRTQTRVHRRQILGHHACTTRSTSLRPSGQHATSVGVPSIQVPRESTTHTCIPSHVRPECTPASHTGELRVAHVFTCTAYGNVCSKTRWFHVDHCDVPPDGWCSVQGYDLLEPTRRCAAPEHGYATLPVPLFTCDCGVLQGPRGTHAIRILLDNVVALGTSPSSRTTTQDRRPALQPQAHEEPGAALCERFADSLSMPTLRRSAPPSFGSSTRRAVQ